MVARKTISIQEAFSQTYTNGFLFVGTVISVYNSEHGHKSRRTFSIRDLCRMLDSVASLQAFVCWDSRRCHLFVSLTEPVPAVDGPLRCLQPFKRIKIRVKLQQRD